MTLPAVIHPGLLAEAHDLGRTKWTGPSIRPEDLDAVTERAWADAEAKVAEMAKGSAAACSGAGGGRRGGVG